MGIIIAEKKPGKTLARIFLYTFIPGQDKKSIVPMIGIPIKNSEGPERQSPKGRLEEWRP